MIYQMLEEKSEIEFKRNLLAESLGCVPSQINYVLSSRFTPERGFIVESRKGSSGCIRITRISYNKNSLLSDVLSAIGSRIDETTARNYLINLVYHGIISERDAALMLAATIDGTLRGLPAEYRDTVRAAVLRQMLVATQQ